MRKKTAKAPAKKRKKAPSPAQLAARAKFIAMVRAKSDGKSAPAKKAKRKGKKRKGLSAAQKADDKRVRAKYDAGGWQDTSFFTRQN